MSNYKDLYKKPQGFVFINGRLQAFDVYTTEKAFSLAEKMTELSYTSGLIEFQTGEKWNELSMGMQGGIIQKKEEDYLTALLTGENRVIVQDLEEIEGRFPEYKQRVQMMVGKIGEFFIQRDMDWNYLKNAEEAVEDDYGMIDGIVNNGKKMRWDSLEL